MATSSSLSTNPFLVNITDYVSEKLDMTNYLTWSYLFKPVLDIYDLSDHIKPSSIIPPKILMAADGKTSTDNPEYLAWHKLDRLILSWINATVKKEVISLIYHSTTSSEAWQTLESHFLDKSTARELHLKFSLDKLVKERRVGNHFEGEPFHGLRSDLRGPEIASRFTNGTNSFWLLLCLLKFKNFMNEDPSDQEWLYELFGEKTYDKG